MKPFRCSELIVLLAASLWTVGGMALLLLVQTGRLTATDLRPAWIYAGLMLVVYLGLLIARFRGDQLLFPLAATLTAVGLVMVRRLTPELGDRQLTWVIIGLATFLTIMVTRWPKLDWLRDLRWIWGGLGLGLVLLTFLFGVDPNGSGARLWLPVPGGNLFQPSELLKIALVIFLASYLDEHGQLIAISSFRLGPVTLPTNQYLVPFGFVWVIALAILVVQRDLGAALLFFGIFLAMLYVGTGKGSWVVMGLAGFLAGAAGLTQLFPHVQERLNLWLNPWGETAARGAYQIVQALIALAAGGLFGAGLGHGYPGYIPAVHTDFVLAAVGEELGLSTTLALLCLYVIFILRGYQIALTAHDQFVQLLATGLTTIFALQTWIIVAGTLKVIPLTGITLPFLSYGGSSLLTNFIAVALLLRCSEEID